MPRHGKQVLWMIMAVVLAWSAISHPAQARERKMKLATLAPKGTIYHRLLQKMSQEWRKIANVKIIIYPDGVMGGESEMVRRLRAGQIHMSLMTANGLAEIDDSVTALQNMPMVFASLDEAEYVREKLLADIRARFEKKGVVLLALQDTGWVKFFANAPAVHPDEFKKLKLFALASDVKAVQIWKAAGFNPVPLDTTDMLTGLKSGMIDALPAPPSYANAMQFNDTAGHMLNINWAPLIGGIVISKNVWDRFPPPIQKEMQASATEFGKEFQIESRNENDKAEEAMKKRGLTIHTPNEEQQAAWEESVKGSYKMIRGEIVPADLYDKVMSLIKEYREKTPSE